jgi:hypothetical protein
MISLALGPGLFDAAGHIVGADFLTFYTGGRFFLEQRLDVLYDFDAQLAFQQQLLAPRMPTEWAAFVYPPPIALLAAPFALSAYLPGLLAWWGAGLAALAASIRLFQPLLRPAAARSTARLLLYSFLFYPTLAWFLYGQGTAFALLILTGAFLCLRRGHDLAAGLVLGLLLYKPQLAIGLVIMLLVQRRWKALVGGALSAGSGLLTILVIWPTTLVHFVAVSPYLVELERPVSWGNHSLAFLSILLLDNIWRPGAEVLGALFTLAAVLGLAGLWWRAPWRPGERAWDLRLASTLVLGLLISPHMYLYDLMLLLLPLAIVWRHYPEGTGGRLLDGGPLLAWSAVLYVATFAGSYLTMAQLKVTAAIGLPAMALQISVPILLAWSWAVSRCAQATNAAGS